jgi:hypothetical protein
MDIRDFDCALFFRGTGDQTLTRDIKDLDSALFLGEREIKH